MIPTQAECALTVWRERTRPTPLATVARQLGAKRSDLGFGSSHIEWTFPDGSRLVVEGRGASHKIEVIP